MDNDAPPIGHSETWVQIDGFINYEISDHGRVRSRLSNKVLRPRVHSNGYIRVSLGAGNDRYVHRLVAFAFHGNPPPGREQVDHADYDRANNKAANIAWVSKAENLAHRRIARGDRHYNYRLTDADIATIRTKRSEGSIVVGAAFGINPRTVRSIWSGDYGR